MIDVQLLYIYFSNNTKYGLANKNFIEICLYDK